MRLMGSFKTTPSNISILIITACYLVLKKLTKKEYLKISMQTT